MEARSIGGCVSIRGGNRGAISQFEDSTDIESAEEEPQPIVPSVVLAQLRNRTATSSPTELDVGSMMSPRFGVGGGASLGRTSSGGSGRTRSDSSFTSPV